MDRYYWQSDQGYRICWSVGQDDAPQFLTWAPRNPETPRNPGELLSRETLSSFQAARQIAEDHWAAQQGAADVG